MAAACITLPHILLFYFIVIIILQQYIIVLMRGISWRRVRENNGHCTAFYTHKKHLLIVSASLKAAYTTLEHVNL